MKHVCTLIYELLHLYCYINFGHNLISILLVTVLLGHTTFLQGSCFYLPILLIYILPTCDKHFLTKIGQIKGLTFHSTYLSAWPD